MTSSTSRTGDGTRVRAARLLLAVFAALVLGVLVPPPAYACSCAMQDPAEALREADAAFVGTLVSLDGNAWTFDVSGVLAGELPDEFTFRAELGDGANCGLTPNVGAQYGLIMYREDTGALTTNGCLQHDPAALAKAGEVRPPTFDSATPDDGPAATGSGGWGVVAATLAGGLAVLGAAVAWARRGTT